MNDVPEQSPKGDIPTPAAPSPQMFARPAPPAPERDTAEQDVAEQDTSDDGATSRFASTGDPRVDRALAQLPDPKEHRREPEDPAPRGGRQEGDSDNATGIDLPDPGLLDAHLADVTTVHRQLQQRLSDLSG